MGTIAPSAVKLFWLKDTESENDVKSSGEVRIDYQRDDESEFTRASSRTVDDVAAR